MTRLLDSGTRGKSVTKAKKIRKAKERTREVIGKKKAQPLRETAGLSRVGPALALSALRAGRCRSLSFQVLFACDDAELVHNANVELADAFLGDAELLADFLQSHALGVVQAGPHANDLALARIKVLQQPIDSVGVLFGRRDHFVLIGPVVRSDIEEVFLAGDIAFAAALFLRNAAGEVLHDRPGSIGAELIAETEIEFLHRLQERHVAVRQKIEAVIDLAGVTLGDGDNQPHVAADELVLDSSRAILTLLDFL